MHRDKNTERDNIGDAKVSGGYELFIPITSTYEFLCSSGRKDPVQVLEYFSSLKIPIEYDFITR